MKFVERIKQLREERQLSQRKLATALELIQQPIAK